MRYIAVLYGVAGLERPVQTHSNSLSAIDDWAKQTLAIREFQQGYIEVYEVKSILIHRINAELKDGKLTLRSMPLT